MAHSLINRDFYESILHFEEREDAQERYYRVMDSITESGGRRDTVRNQILRAYAMLFCDDVNADADRIATPADVEASADRLYVGRASFDPKHWYRMRYHFPVIDEDNYDRFAALVISDLCAGPLHQEILNGGDTLLVGEPDPLIMTSSQRKSQRVRRIGIPGGLEELAK